VRIVAVFTLKVPAIVNVEPPGTVVVPVRVFAELPFPMYIAVVEVVPILIVAVLIRILAVEEVDVIEE
jgi:hypothetical protein